jgi:hypothetical protein
MRKSIRSAALAGFLAVLALGAALAQQSLTVHRRYDVPLPRNVTTSDNWLDMGEDNSAPVGSMNKYAHMDNNDSLDEIQAGPNLEQNW